MYTRCTPPLSFMGGQLAKAFYFSCFPFVSQ